MLITGESGTGKELFAQAIHNASPRATRPFVAINCAAFPETLLESELFGHEEGAFTGARRGGRRGLFEAAHTGTLFLDEIGDMPLTLQTRLLRVLQERRITRLGANHAIPVDVRVIAATHQDLTDLVAQRSFRQDLYYRLNTLRLQLPALRDRREDIPALAQHLLRQSLARLGVAHTPAEAVLHRLGDALQRHGWPGNVRELENLCDRLAAHLASHRSMDTVDWSELHSECPELLMAPSDLAAQPERASSGAAALTPTLSPPADKHQRRRQQALAALEAHGGHPGAAAAALGVSRATFWRWCRRQD